MPKVKTNSGAKKRFALTGSGKIKRKHAYKSHILTKKTKKAEEKPRSLCYIDCSRYSQPSRFACNQIVGKVSYF